VRRVAIISINGMENTGGVERVVERHVRLLNSVAAVRVFSLSRSGWIGSLRRSRIGNLLASCMFCMGSSAVARLWAGRKGVVISHGFSSIGMGCDLVIAHGCWAGYVRRTGQPIGGFGRIIYASEWLAARLSHRVATVSDSVFEQWNTYYGLRPDKSFVQLNSIDSRVFFARGDAHDPCGGNSARVLFVGRFEPGKGTAFLDRLHQELKLAQSEFQVVICSPGEVDDSTKNRLDQFEFISGLSPEQIAREYNRADLFLLPSLYEAFELSTIEALACGTPVLLNDTGSRPTLEQLHCPGVFRLENAASPLDALRTAAAAFRGLNRQELSGWAHQYFDGKLSDARLLAFCQTPDGSQ
jgi:glycosyltransferase involved in cell wall biosynthesis